MTNLKISDKLAFLQDINAYTDAGAQRKTLLHREGKAVLKRIADALGLEKADYRLHSNLAGPAVAGEVMLHTDHFFIQLSDSTFSGGGPRLLYRSCAGRNDCCGGPNCYISLEDLRDDDDEVDRFLARLRKFGSLQPA